MRRGLDPSVFEISLVEILQPETFVHLANQLQAVLERVDKINLLAGYEMVLPFQAIFQHDPVKHDEDLPAFDMSLRETDRLVNGPRVCSVEGVIRSRKQYPLLYMDDELDELAKEMERLERARKEAEKRVRTYAISFLFVLRSIYMYSASFDVLVIQYYITSPLLGQLSHLGNNPPTPLFHRLYYSTPPPPGFMHFLDTGT